MIDFDWKFPYPSRRSPVLARNIVSTSQPLAAQAGLKMLQDGGNAVDAAIATAITLTVVEPTMNGIGSDAFAIIWDGKKLHGLNASGRSPAAWTPERYAGKTSIPDKGWDAVTVPGCVSAWMETHKKFGKLPFEKLFEQAIRYAEEGYLVTPIIAGNWESSGARLGSFAEWSRVFMPQGRPPKAGELWKSPDHGKTLRRIAETKGEAYYRGDIAEKIVAQAKADNAAMTLEDLASHTADWVELAEYQYHGYTLHEIPPNGQGLAALICLGILSQFDLSSYPVDSADSLHLQIEAMKLAFADAWQYIADPNAMELGWRDLLDANYLAERAKMIDMKVAANPDHGMPKGGTVLLTTADQSGMMVSFIQSNFWGFGSGIVIPGTGIAMQNRGNGFSLREGHPNRVGPRKRPYHTIIPGFVSKGGGDGEPVMAFGVMGGSMQPQGHVQMMLRIADYGQNPQAASDAPRWRARYRKKIYLEEGHSQEVIEALAARGHEIDIRGGASFGGAQFAMRYNGMYLGASDSRKDGCSVGF
jgi:gamma-glutamyltranspeptidase / glutathione hydrolase